MQEYIIKSNPKEAPIYPYARTEYYIELISGKFSGLHFSFGIIEIEGENITYDYNLLYIPESIVIENEIQTVISEILQDFIKRGYYEFDTK
jgi:hypothetical protein